MASPATLERVRERIYRTARRTLEEADAADIAQNVTVLLIEKYEHVSDEVEVLRLALVIMSKMRSGLWRTRARRGENDSVMVDDVPIKSPADGPEELLLKKAMAERIAAGIGKSGEPCKTIFRLKFKGAPVEEIRKAIGVETVNAASLRIMRCMERLRGLL